MFIYIQELSEFSPGFRTGFLWENSSSLISELVCSRDFVRVRRYITHRRLQTIVQQKSLQGSHVQSETGSDADSSSSEDPSMIREQTTSLRHEDTVERSKEVLSVRERLERAGMSPARAKEFPDVEILTPNGVIAGRIYRNSRVRPVEYRSYGRTYSLSDWSDPRVEPCSPLVQHFSAMRWRWA